MENTFKAACKMQPFKSEVSCSVYNSGNDVGKQTQQISNLISQGVDAIVIDAASPTGLKRHRQAGLRARDHRDLVRPTSSRISGGLTVNTDQVKFAGSWAASSSQASCTARAISSMVTGFPGTSVDTDRNNGSSPVIKKYPNMKIVAHYSGSWDSSTRKRATAAQLPSLPQVTASGSPAPLTASSRHSSTPVSQCRSSRAKAKTATAGTCFPPATTQAR